MTTSTMKTSIPPSHEHPFAQYVRVLGKGKKGSRSLTEAEAYDAMSMIMAGQVEDVQLGAFLMLLRVMPLSQAYDAIDWSVIVLLGALLPVGEALQSTGTTDLIAGQLLAGEQRAQCGGQPARQQHHPGRPLVGLNQVIAFVVVEAGNAGGHALTHGVHLVYWRRDPLKRALRLDSR